MTAEDRNVPKYARLESERRYLVKPEFEFDLTRGPFRRITDQYITGTLLRLRQIELPNNEGFQYKLCKKYEPLSSSTIPITNLYLTLTEYDTLSALSGSRLSKRRYGLEEKGRVFSIDVFEDRLESLALAETDVSSEEFVPVPAWATQEVTDDPFFQGGTLATTTASQLAEKLAQL